jgi:uncharacterized protein YkwD
MERRSFVATAALGVAGVTSGCSALGDLVGSEPLNAETIAQRTHERVNTRRRTHDRSELGYDEDLEAIAADHSADMAKRDYFSHEDPEGHKWAHRYEEHGYDCRVEVEGTGTVTGGENIYEIAYSDRSFTDDEIAEKCVTGWMNSPEHRENMLQEYWSVEGIGVHIAEADGETAINITQNFC